MSAAVCMVPQSDLKFEKGLWPTYHTLPDWMKPGAARWLDRSVWGQLSAHGPSHLFSTLSEVRDSKLLTPLKRDLLAPRIKATVLTWGVAFASAEEIDALGIVLQRGLPPCAQLDY